MIAESLFIVAFPLVALSLAFASCGCIMGITDGNAMMAVACAIATVINFIVCIKLMMHIFKML